MGFAFIFHLCAGLSFSQCFFPLSRALNESKLNLSPTHNVSAFSFFLYSPLFLFIDTDWIADIILLLLLFLLLHLARNCNALLSQLVVALTVKWQIAIKPTNRIKPLNRMIRMIHSSTCAIFARGKMGIFIV